MATTEEDPPFAVPASTDALMASLMGGDTATTPAASKDSLFGADDPVSAEASNVLQSFAGSQSGALGQEVVPAGASSQEQTNGAPPEVAASSLLQTGLVPGCTLNGDGRLFAGIDPQQQAAQNAIPQVQQDQLSQQMQSVNLNDIPYNGKQQTMMNNVQQKNQGQGMQGGMMMNQGGMNPFPHMQQPGMQISQTNFYRSHPQDQQSMQPNSTAGMHNINPQQGVVPTLQQSQMSPQQQLNGSSMPFPQQQQQPFSNGASSPARLPGGQLPPHSISPAHSMPSPVRTQFLSQQQQQHPIHYGSIMVDQPLLLSANSGLFGMGQSPHWSYQITSTVVGSNGMPGQTWTVRRRFRHVVALEDRLRSECPGAILPPRYVLCAHHKCVVFC